MIDASEAIWLVSALFSPHSPQLTDHFKKAFFLELFM